MAFTKASGSSERVYTPEGGLESRCMRWLLLIPLRERHALAACVRCWALLPDHL
jgi:hypothetical protein